MLCEITPVGKPGEPVDPGFGHPGPPNRPTLPIQLPPFPPDWDGKPPQLPPVIGGGPIIPDWPVISPKPPKPPGEPPTVGGGPIEPPLLWPPLDPGAGIGGTGKYLILIHVFGVGSRWLFYDATKPVEPPPVAQPK